MSTKTEPSPAPATSEAPRRPTPWSVFIAAGVFFAIGMFLYLEVRREVAEAEVERQRRALADPEERPKLLGLDIIPQEVRSATPGASAAGAASAAPSASAPPGSAAAARPSASASAAPREGR